MICPNCKQEIEDGSIYCDHCGQTIQIVPDYNALDDVLPSILEGKQNPAKKESNQKTKDSKASDAKAAEAKVKKQRMLLGCGVLVVACALIIGLVGWNVYTHSYTYYMDRGASLETEKQYAEANKYYALAIEVDATNEAFLAYGRNAYRLGDYDQAKEYLYSVIESDGSNLEAFELLCKIFEAERDYVSIEDLASYTQDSDVLAILNEALILPPSFSLKSGKYDDDITLFLTAPKGNEIYYSLDGSDPVDGEPYDSAEGILLTDGTTTVRAVCKNADGKFGFDEEQTYKITYKAPGYPTVDPMNGTFREETYITITPEQDGDRIFYTWDGSTPTTESAEYTEPILVPSGNNILSIIVINRHDLISDVLQCNYIYRP